MSLPTPDALSDKKATIPLRKLTAFESYYDVMGRAPQEARPFLRSTVKHSDSHCVLLNNGYIMTYNGVLINATNHTYSEPLRRLDGTILYADGWFRSNDGTFTAPSGLRITKNLVLIHKNGQQVHNDGITVMTTGQQIKTNNGPQVGIIYRPGLSHVVGPQIWPMEEPPIDQAVLKNITAGDPAKGIIFRPEFLVPRADTRTPLGAALTPDTNAGDAALLDPWSGSQASFSDVQKYVHPHARLRSRAQSLAQSEARCHAQHQAVTYPQIPVDPKRRRLTLDEICANTPPYLHCLFDCDMDGCGTNIWGIPLCLPSDQQAKVFPYVQEGLERINNRC